METQISIRDINKEIFNEFKALSVKKRIKLGKALTLAMIEWMNEEKEVPKKSLLKMKSWDWGKGTEKSSEEVDEIVYGA